MSVSVQTPYKKYTAAAAATVFPTTFRVVLAGDLQVRVDAVVVTTGFTLSTLGLSAGVDVTFTTPMVGGEIVELQRIIPKSRVNDYQQLGNFDAAVVNADIDRLWMSNQELGEEINRAILVPIGSGTDPQDLIDQLIDSAATAVAAAASADTDAATATAAAAAAAASAASTGLPALTGKTLNLLRVKADESGYETRTAVQARSDIGAAENSPGLIGYFPFASAPTGWLKANGALVSRTTYAALFAAANADGLVSEATWAATSWGRFADGDGSTTFRLPDLRGEVIRGWDDSRGVDSGRATGTSQLDAFQGHQFSYNTTSTGGSATIFPILVGPFDAAGQTARIPNSSSIVSDGVNGTPRLAAETRARNVSLLACVKF